MIPIFLTKISFLNKGTIAFLILSALGLIIEGTKVPCWSEGSRILSIVQRMESTFNSVEDYSCEVEQIFYKDGKEDQRYHFRYYYMRNKKIRIDFISPYPGMSIYYQGGEKEATLKLFQGLPFPKFRLSIHNPLIKTVVGQRIDQTDMEYFIHFLMKNLKMVKQREEEFEEDTEKVRFLFWAMDYIEDKRLEKYRIHLSKRNWLPILIERQNIEGQPLEVTLIQEYMINKHLEPKFFTP